MFVFFFSSRRRHTRSLCDWSSDVCSSDLDCRLGVKKSFNQVQADGTTKEKKELIWGYGSGVAACTNPVYGDVVLADYTRSEERRVGKECRSRWSEYHRKKKERRVDRAAE